MWCVGDQQSQDWGEKFSLWCCVELGGMVDEVFLEENLASKGSTKVVALVEVEEFCFQFLLHVQTVEDRKSVV